MLFTWSTKDLCIVFYDWHITGTGSLIFSILAIILLTAGYEAVREMSRRYDSYSKNALEPRRSGDDMTSESYLSHIQVRFEGAEDCGSRLEKATPNFVLFPLLRIKC